MIEIGKDQETTNNLYPNKGGHKDRSEYWKLMRQVSDLWCRSAPVIIRKELSWGIRRSMFRDQSDGKH